MGASLDRTAHWKAIYEKKSSPELTWHQLHLALSLSMISALRLPHDTSILDVGAGDSTLVDDLLAQGYTDLSVLDCCEPALERIRQRLGAGTGRLRWLACDVLQTDLGTAQYRLWHDRAMFHFLVDPAERDVYLACLQRALQPGGFWLVATFAADGPQMCSGLPTQRYAAADLVQLLGGCWELVEQRDENHHKPQGGEQHFQYSLFRKQG